MLRVHATVLASGAGSRFGDGVPKQFLELAGRPVLLHSLAAFDAHPRIAEVHLVVDRAERSRVEAVLRGATLGKLARLLDGGATRQESSRIGVDGLPASDAVLIHDAARPLVTARMIDDCVEALDAGAAAVTVAIPSPDTVVEIDAGEVAKIPDRRRMMLVQTPQGFRVRTIQRAHARYAAEGGFPVTDDCGLVARYALAPIRVIAGDPANLKITYPEDLARAAELIRRREG